MINKEFCRWLFQVGFLCLALFVKKGLWVGHIGVNNARRIKSAVASNLQSNEKLIKRNKVLTADIEDLKLGHEGIEERARNEL